MFLRTLVNMSKVKSSKNFINNPRSLLVYQRKFSDNKSTKPSATSEEKRTPRQLSAAELATCVDAKSYGKLRKLHIKQERFQIDDGRPVFMKGGTPDIILFQLTNVLAAIGIGWSFLTLYQLAYNIHPERVLQDGEETEE